MRFMVIMLPGAAAESGALPDEAMLTAMGKYNEELVKAGVLLAGEGLLPSSKGVRVSFEGGKPKVTDGPFVEAKEVIGGFWIFQTKTRDECIEWVKRCPVMGPEQIEIRQIAEPEDFGPALTPELREAEERLRASVESKK